VLERLWSLRGTVSSTVSLTTQVVPVLARGDLKGAGELIGRHRPCPARRVYSDLLGASPEAPLAELERVADERQFEAVQGCGAYLWMLGTIGSAAPFIGLFGTVMGIIRAFHTMAIAGTGGFAVVAGGIFAALIPTQLGLPAGLNAGRSCNHFHARVHRRADALRSGPAPRA